MDSGEEKRVQLLASGLQSLWEPYMTNSFVPLLTYFHYYFQVTL